MWHVEVSRIEKWLKKLAPDQKAAVVRRIALLERLGDKLAMPNVRSLGKGLYEIREMTFGNRLYFYFSEQEQKIVIVVAAGGKDSQERDIKQAREAMK